MATEKNITIDIQITGYITLTEDELRQVIDNGDDKLMSQIVKRSFSPDGFASLTPCSIDTVNEITGENYEFDDFEWLIDI